MQTQVKTPMEKVNVLSTVAIREHYQKMNKLEKKYFFDYMSKQYPLTPAAWRNKLNGIAPMEMPQRKRATEFFEAWEKNIVLM